MKSSVFYLLLPSLLLLFCCDCLAAADVKVDPDDQQSLHKTTPRLKNLRLDPSTKENRSRDLVLTINSSRADIICPSSAIIAPCTCTVSFENLTYFDCTFAQSVDQLVEIFQQEFPVKKLYRFQMMNNSAINFFPSFMNGISFESVYLGPDYFILEEISENFLFDLKDTLREISVYHSQLTTDFFPFHMLPAMSQLEELIIYDSGINRIPQIQAPELAYFSVPHSPVQLLVNGTFSIGSGPLWIELYDNEIRDIEVGSFFFADQNSTDSKEPIHIDVYHNQLQSIKAGTFPLRNGPMLVHLQNNQISSIEPGTFILPASTDSLTISLNLSYNLLTTVDETVFGNMMPFIGILILEGNPLTCGCDIAWLILNADFLQYVDNPASCADGTNLHDLDPQQYIDLC